MGGPVAGGSWTVVIDHDLGGAQPTLTGLLLQTRCIHVTCSLGPKAGQSHTSPVVPSQGVADH